MKRMFCILLAISMLAFALCACTGGNDNSTDQSETTDISEKEETTSEAEDTSESSEEQLLTFIMYHPDKEYNFIQNKEMQYDGTLEGMFDVMIAENVLPDSAVFNSLTVKDGVAYLDMNKQFQEDVSAGTIYEFFTMASLVNTVIKHLEVEKVMLTCEGGVFSTAHVGPYEEPLGFFETEKN